MRLKGIRFRFNQRFGGGFSLVDLMSCLNATFVATGVPARDERTGLAREGTGTGTVPVCSDNDAFISHTMLLR